MRTVDALTLCALGMVATLFAVMLLRGGADARAADHSATGGLIALTAQAGSGQKDTALFLVDTQSKHIALYTYDSNNFHLVAARSYMYDLGIHDAGKRAGISVVEAKELYEQDAAVKPGEGSGRGRRR